MLVKKYMYFWTVGAGSAGSVISARLSENGSYSVLLLEAGGYPSPLADVPLLAGILPLTNLAWNYQTEPQKGHKASIGKVCNTMLSCNYSFDVNEKFYFNLKI